MKLPKMTPKQIIVIVLFALFFSILLSENNRVYNFDDVPLDEKTHSKFKIHPIYYLFGSLLSIGIFFPYFLLTDKIEEDTIEEEPKLKMEKKRKRRR